MEAINADPDLYLLSEPDNETLSPPAIWAKRHLGRFPVLEPGDRDDDYRRLWTWILDGAAPAVRLQLAKKMLRGVRPGGRRRFHQGRLSPLMQSAGLVAANPRDRREPELRGHRLFVKTVMAPLSIEWLASEFDLAVLVLLRHPGNVLASWMSLDLSLEFARLDDRPAVRRLIEAGTIPRPGSGDLERLAWQLGVLNLGLEEAAARHPDWVMRTHEDLCIDPLDKFRRLYSDLDLTWNEGVEEFLVVNDRPGDGFRTQRKASEQPEAWKKRLDAEQIGILRRVLSEFPLTSWSEDDLTP